MLDKQIQIYSCDTGNFYSETEARLHWKNHELRREKRQLNEELGEIASKLKAYGVQDCDLNAVYKGRYSNPEHDQDETFLALQEEYRKKKEDVSVKTKEANEVKAELLATLSSEVEANIASGGKHHIRKLNEDSISEKNIISVFDSYFTRTIGAEPDKLCEDFMVVQVYYFDVIKDLIYHGFTYKGEKYIYFTSSAGQIRTKKTVFVKESVWQKYEKSIMCGLTIDAINAKGGNNPNKHLAYLALANSATDVWEEFDIDKSIVIDDFETEVFGEYDLVDDETYSVKRTEGHVPIPHTDGAGMMLPSLGKNRMVRLPWVKGLLGAFDFVKFIEQHGCSGVIKDIYGKEHNVIEEGIEVIFTKSQFKMWKYYDSWEQYKHLYKKYNCSAGCTNIEEDRIKDATINYQMLQTLTDITDDEIRKIAKLSTERLDSLTVDYKKTDGEAKKKRMRKRAVDSIKEIFGVTPYNTNQTAFQKSIGLYPNLINDEYTKEHLRTIKNSIVKRCKAGKLQVNGKYTFILPDLYAACQHWFLGQEKPEGLLKDGQVYCNLFRNKSKLDCLRSPHLYREHAVRENMAHRCNPKQQEISEWFDTSAVYTSTHDLISKILQFDVDGDKALVVADETLIKVAERNMKGIDPKKPEDKIVPLYYNMRKAGSVLLNSESIYNGLNAAFTGGNIGIYSNNISKIWNSDVFVNGSKEEQREAVKIVKLLCMENNFVIDYAKTLYKPTRPDDIHEKIIKYTKEDLPHFFTYAKDKAEKQVVPVNNSFVNRLHKDKIVKNPRINCQRLGLGKIDYELMMTNPNTDVKAEFVRGKVVEEKTDPLIVKYCKLNSQHHFVLDASLKVDKDASMDVMRKSQFGQSMKCQMASEEIKEELSKFGYTDEEIADILVKFLYGMKKSRYKVALWLCYGDIIYENLKRNVKATTQERQCEDCGRWILVSTKDNETCRCAECQATNKRELARLRQQKYRQKQM